MAYKNLHIIIDSSFIMTKKSPSQVDYFSHWLNRCLGV